MLAGSATQGSERAIGPRKAEASDAALACCSAHVQLPQCFTACHSELWDSHSHLGAGAPFSRSCSAMLSALTPDKLCMWGPDPCYPPSSSSHPWTEWQQMMGGSWHLHSPIQPPAAAVPAVLPGHFEI